MGTYQQRAQEESDQAALEKHSYNRLFSSLIGSPVILLRQQAPQRPPDFSGHAFLLAVDPLALSAMHWEELCICQALKQMIYIFYKNNDSHRFLKNTIKNVVNNVVLCGSAAQLHF
jgi:hypothetical protein